MKNNAIKIFTDDTIVIKRIRGWRTKLATAIKSFPPASLEGAHRVAKIDITITQDIITVRKHWSLL